jgi:ABC-type long-subunit fatty acid transport system fused permease/ATPase subunit
MYVSYAVGIAFAVAAFVMSNLIFKANLKVTFISIVGTLVVFMPIIMRLSRNIWINFFMHYDKDLVKK